MKEVYWPPRWLSTEARLRGSRMAGSWRQTAAGSHLQPTPHFCDDGRQLPIISEVSGLQSPAEQDGACGPAGPVTAPVAQCVRSPNCCASWTDRPQIETFAARCAGECSGRGRRRLLLVDLQPSII